MRGGGRQQETFAALPQLTLAEMMVYGPFFSDKKSMKLKIMQKKKRYPLLMLRCTESIQTPSEGLDYIRAVLCLS